MYLDKPCIKRITLTRYKYDNKLKSYTDGKVIKVIECNELEQIIEEISNEGEFKKTTFTYDELDRQSEIIEEFLEDNYTIITRNEFNDDNEIITALTTFEMDEEILDSYCHYYSYDEAGNITQMVFEKGKELSITEIKHFEKGNLEWTTHYCDGKKVLRFIREKDKNITTEINYKFNEKTGKNEIKGKLTEYNNKFDKPVKSLYNDKEKTIYKYDEYGRQLEMISSNKGKKILVKFEYLMY